MILEHEGKINDNNEGLSDLDPSFLEFLISPEESCRKFMKNHDISKDYHSNLQKVLLQCFVSNAHQDAETLLTNLKSEIQGFEPLLDDEQRSNLEKTLNLFKEFHKIFPKSINEVDYSETLKDKLINFVEDNSLQLASIFGSQEKLNSLKELLNTDEINNKDFDIDWASLSYDPKFLNSRALSKNFNALVHYTFCLSFSQYISGIIFHNTEAPKNFFLEFILIGDGDL